MNATLGLLAAMLLSPLACDRGFGKPKAGEVCAKQDEADCQDAETIITCDGGKYLTYPCKGAEGCKRSGDQITCDESRGAVGDACSHNGNYTCTVDAAAQLVCAEKAWATSRACRGPNQCKTTDKEVQCDQTVAEVGDVCEVAKDKEPPAACTPDSKSVLECTSGKYAVKHTCDTKCEVAGKFIQCATTKKGAPSSSSAKPASSAKP